MKKLLFIVLAVLGIAAYIYYHFSTPRVLQRRVDSLLGELNFGIVSMGKHGEAADRFAAHFTDLVTFSGESSIIEGSESREALRERYLEYRSYTKSSSAGRTGDFSVRVIDPTHAEVTTTVELSVTMHGSGTDDREIPVQLAWEKIDGDWLLSRVVMRGTGGHEF